MQQPWHPYILQYLCSTTVCVLNWPLLLPDPRALRSLLPRLAVLPTVVLAVVLTVLLAVLPAVMRAALMLYCSGPSVSWGGAAVLEGPLDAAEDLQQENITAVQDNAWLGPKHASLTMHPGQLRAVQ
jgi:hypothetical protein